MIGLTISHYKIIEKLGEGGMGVVYRAHDTKLDRDVALKFLPHFLTSAPTEKERFYHEARAAAALTHANIAVVYEIGEHEGPAYAGAPAGKQIFIAMEYVEGQTLKEIVAKEPVSIKKVLDIAIQVSEGLAAAHEKGIVHRDIKSDNIILTPKGQPKITDFGLAKLKGATKLTKAGSTLGTAAYMSPEQAQGEDVDLRSDIFSFGVVLYELLTGKLPFRGEHQAALLYSLINEDAEQIARFNNKVTPEIERIVSKALAKDKQERYQHADEMLADLRTERKKLEYTKAGYLTATVASKKMVPSKRRLIRVGLVVSALLVLALLGIMLNPFKHIADHPTVVSSNEKSIAVLPFNNMSENKEDEYFSDGITEDIITDLAKIQGLRIIARNSAFQFKGENVDVKKVGEELNVRYVMEGSVQRSMNRLRINAQLIDAVSGFHIWADRYDRELKDAFAVQDEITGHIVSALTVTLSGTERQAMASSRTLNPAAHDLYLQGLFHFYQFSEEENLNRALEYFQKAIQEDPAYAEPYAGIAFTYIGLADAYMPPHEAYPRAISASRKALEIDSMSGEAHSALGSALTDYQWDFDEGAKEMRRALELSPNSFDVNTFAAIYSTIRGNPVEAIAYADHAITLDPLSAAASWIKEWCLYLARRYDDVIAQSKRTAELDSNFFYFDDLRGAVYREKGMLKEALQEYFKMQKLHPDLPLFGLAITYARMGDIAEAKRILNALEETSKKRYIAADQIAMVCLSIGETDRVFEYLDKAFQARSGLITMLKIYPEYDPVRSDPRFRALLKRAGLE